MYHRVLVTFGLQLYSVNKDVKSELAILKVHFQAICISSVAAASHFELQLCHRRESCQETMGAVCLPPFPARLRCFG